jgi:hypothetical protein
MTDEDTVSIPELIATDPVTRPAVVFDRWWLTTLVMQSPSPAGEATVNVTLARCSSADGSLSGETVTLTLDNLFARAQADPTLMAAMAGIVSTVQAVAAERGIVQS